MSGSATQDDNGIRVLWWFVVGAASRHCGVSVYVPASSNARDVAGSPAYYYVLRDTANAWYARFAIDQVHNRGRWVPAGTYRVYNGQIVVKLVNRGVDWVGSTNTYAHLAAAQVRVTCTSA
jgi:translation initiation factor IF-2